MPQVRRSREPSPPISSDFSRKRYFCGRHIIVRGGGRASSIIRTGEGDVLPDTDGLLRHTLVGEDDNSEDGDGEDSGDDDDPSVRESVEPRDISNRKWIARVGKKFGDGEVHRSVKPLLERNFDGPWVTFRKVPKDVLDRMFGCFRTLWRWDSQDDESIYEGFINVLKGRYRNIMGEWRIQPKEKAKTDGHDIEDDEENFGITYKYPPDIVPLDTCEEMCKVSELTHYCFIVYFVCFI
ncbi:uncharacterized protein LOC143576792 isoform X1 [Bidens hawaiensis]|uniref:uncharacterized protein LOC143576792 isoform X1 n=1 Tax=Bidens hawaiensis TaxID=980011 RepID=UPI00404A3179